VLVSIVDGNKRSAFVAVELFLVHNGCSPACRAASHAHSRQSLPRPPQRRHRRGFLCSTLTRLPLGALSMPAMSSSDRLLARRCWRSGFALRWPGSMAEPPACAEPQTSSV
jgi:hypothetical protein